MTKKKKGSRRDAMRHARLHETHRRYPEYDPSSSGPNDQSLNADVEDLTTDDIERIDCTGCGYVVWDKAWITPDGVNLELMVSLHLHAIGAQRSSFGAQIDGHVEHFRKDCPNPKEYNLRLQIAGRAGPVVVDLDQDPG